MKLVLGGDYPQAPPRGFFLTKIYHPNVSSAGEICVNTLKRDWKADTGIAHILQVIRCLLIVPFPESSLNDEAGKLFMESYDDYARKARLMTSIHAAKKESEDDLAEGEEKLTGAAGAAKDKKKDKKKGEAEKKKKKKKLEKKKSLRRL